MKFLKWLGIAALFAVPAFLIFRKLFERRAEYTEDEFDIFAEELS